MLFLTHKLYQLHYVVKPLQSNQMWQVNQKKKKKIKYIRTPTKTEIYIHS